MTYWLCITTKENWEITKETKILGFKNKVKRLSNMINVGDIGFIYIKRQRGISSNDSSIIAKFEIISNLYQDDTKLFLNIPEFPNELFQQRIKIKILKILDTPLIFKPLVNDLTLFKNKHNWFITLFGRSLINLSRADYLYLNSKFYEI
jgi:predicted RNA-binding protein